MQRQQSSHCYGSLREVAPGSLAPGPRLPVRHCCRSAPVTAHGGAASVAKERSPFGELLRAHRLRLGLSQEGLSQRIDAQIQLDPALAELGGLTAKAISNLESSRDPA